MICVSVNRTFFIIDPFKLEIFSNTGWATFGEPYNNSYSNVLNRIISSFLLYFKQH